MWGIRLWLRLPVFVFLIIIICLHEADAKWRRSKTCSSIPPIWIRFCVIWGSRIFQTVRLRTNLHPNLKVNTFNWAFCRLCAKISHFGIYFIPRISHLSLMRAKRESALGMSVPVRITHMALVLRKAAVVCCVSAESHRALTVTRARCSYYTTSCAHSPDKKDHLQVDMRGQRRNKKINHYFIVWVRNWTIHILWLVGATKCNS